jgi:hypothetical protein
MSSYERTGWRDRALSERHRLYGGNLPAVDLDFVEYDNCTPRALVEYKGISAMPFAGTANTQALKRLADSAGLPLFIVRYDRQNWTFEVHPYNSIARTHMDEPLAMSEVEYVKLLHHLRGREARPELLCRLKNTKPSGGKL